MMPLCCVAARPVVRGCDERQRVVRLRQDVSPPTLPGHGITIAVQPPRLSGVHKKCHQLCHLASMRPLVLGGVQLSGQPSRRHRHPSQHPRLSVASSTSEHPFGLTTRLLLPSKGAKQTLYPSLSLCTNHQPSCPNPCQKLQVSQHEICVHPTNGKEKRWKKNQNPNDSMYNPERRPNLKGISRVFLYQSQRPTMLPLQSKHPTPTQNSNRKTGTKAKTPPFDLLPLPPLHMDHNLTVDRAQAQAPNVQKGKPPKKTPDEPKPHLEAPRKQP